MVYCVCCVQLLQEVPIISLHGFNQIFFVAHTDCVLCEAGAEVLCMYSHLLTDSVSSYICAFCLPIKQRCVTIRVVYVMSMLSDNNPGIRFNTGLFKTIVGVLTTYHTQYTRDRNIQVSHELRSLLRESGPYVKIYRYNPKHLCPKLNCYGDNGHRKVWASGVSTYCKPSVTPYSSTAHTRQRDVLMQ